MTIYTVFVKDRNGYRFIDTSWALQEAATKRVAQIERSMVATSFGGYVWFVEMKVEDLEIAPVGEEARN